ncbi:MAG: outer membrane beta-barrel protein [Bacteroidota bacterium]
MKFYYTIFLAIVLLPISIFAQSNYKPGYVIQSNGDTLRGYINYREWDNNPTSIAFKNSLSDKQSRKFDPASANKFEINGLESYVTYRGPLTTGNTDLSNLPNAIDSAEKMMSVFLKQVTTGKYLTLYAHIDGLKARYLIGERGAIPIELKYYRFFSDGEVEHEDIYKEQLTSHIKKFMTVNSLLSKQIDDAKYEQRDLEPLINKVNGQANATSKQALVRFFAGLAANSTKTKVNGVNSINGKHSYTGVTPLISFGADFFGNADVQKFMFRVELSYTTISPHYHFSGDPGFGIQSTTVTDYKFNQRIFDVTPQVVYNIYNTAKLKVYLDGGMGFSFSGYSSHVLSGTNTTIFGTVTSKTINDPYKLSSFSLNFPIQTGVIFNSHVEAYLSFTAAPNVSAVPTVVNLTTASVNNQSINLGVKYLFK